MRAATPPRLPDEARRSRCSTTDAARARYGPAPAPRRLTLRTEGGGRFPPRRPGHPPRLAVGGPHAVVPNLVSTPRPRWPVLTRRRMAGFEVSTEAIVMRKGTTIRLGGARGAPGSDDRLLATPTRMSRVGNSDGPVARIPTSNVACAPLSCVFLFPTRAPGSSSARSRLAATVSPGRSEPGRCPSRLGGRSRGAQRDPAPPLLAGMAKPAVAEVLRSPRQRSA